jgi:hypothetical protein
MMFFRLAVMIVRLRIGSFNTTCASIHEFISSFSVFEATKTEIRIHTHTHTLPFPAKLNIQADSLATAFQYLTAPTAESGPMIPGNDCRLVNGNQIIHSHHRRICTRRGH